MSSGARGGGGVGLGFVGCWESDGVSGRSNQPNKGSVVISELKFGELNESTFLVFQFLVQKLPLNDDKEKHLLCEKLYNF